MENLLFYLLVLSTLLILLIDILIGRMKNKSQMHYFFISFISSIFLWNLSVLLQFFFKDSGFSIFLEQLYFACVVLVSVSLLFSGIIFARTKIKFTWKYLLLFIIPAVSLALIFTNNYHRLFIEKNSLIISEIVYGKYFPVHIAYSYLCIIVGLYHFVYFSIKNSGFFSRQSMLIFWGVFIPLLVDTLSTFKIVDGPVYIENICFTVLVVCIAFAIFKYNFLNVVPIALQNVVDNISDAFVVLDGRLSIIDFNRAFENIFSTAGVRRNIGLASLFESKPELNFNTGEILALIRKVQETGKAVVFEKYIASGGSERFFTVEITPIVSQRVFLGTLILLKDVTEYKKNMEALKEQQEIIMEQERLASLGQLIGGIAHNLKTPIMSLSGGIEALRDLAAEYRDSIDDPGVNAGDHREIAGEMLEWLDKMKPYCSYMSDVISAVKGQTVQMNTSTSGKFTINELVKRVELLMKHELKKYHCVLNIHAEIDMNTEIKGEVNNLVQVFDNIIINAVHAYEGGTGTIDLRIIRSGDNVEFTFRDYAKGIPKNIADRLFKEMITTKGKNGTGLGLYMSYSTVKGRFGGNMFFTSKEGYGTTFYISVPCMTYIGREVSK